MSPGGHFFYRLVCRRRTVVVPLLALGYLCFYSCSSDDPVDPGPPPPTPVLVSLSDSVVVPGDTLMIEGENFASLPANNRVVFNNLLASAVPYFASPGTLEVVVPPYANTGPMHVTSKGVNSAPKTVEVVRGIGDVWVIGGGLNSNYRLPAPAGTERYLVIPHSASTAGIGTYSYKVTPESSAVFPSSPSRARKAERRAVPLPVEFERRIRDEAAEYIENNAPLKPGASVSRAGATPPATLDFWVLKCASCSTQDPANYNSVTAELKYPGETALIYADVVQPTGAFTDAEYESFGMDFDANIFPTDTTFFGPPSDIDQNDRVIILFTPQVNELTPDGQGGNGFISGFFLVNDLAPNFFPFTSNGGEIFYSMVPDPLGERGNIFPKTSVTDIVPSTLAHEFEHMISFGHRFVFLGNQTTLQFAQVTWLEEGMAHMAENLNGLHSSNRNRSILYLFDPGKVSIMGSDTLAQRGGIFLFLRYLGDQLGEGIYKSMLQNSSIGRRCVENVSGANFFDSVADFLGALYLSDQTITSDPRYKFTSPEVPLGALFVDSHDVGDGPFGTGVQNATGDFFDIGGLHNPATRFKVNGSTNGSIRSLVVRIK